MPGQSYDRLLVEDFGRQLIVSGDLDPIYIALFGADFDVAQQQRWMVAYWCLYHAGAASWISEYENHYFWSQLLAAAHNKAPAPTGLRWPRGKERRHWRGQQAIASAMALKDRYRKPEQFCEYVEMIEPYREEPRPFGEVVKRVKEHRGFGDWIAFKIADMIDRVEGIAVDFEVKDVFLYKDPHEAALMLWRQKVGAPANAQPKDGKKAVGQVVSYLVGRFSQLTAPPLHDRPIGIQEVETVLCKWKSHVKGFYPLNNDIDEINHGLEPWLKHSRAAQRFAEAMPRKEDSDV